MTSISDRPAGAASDDAGGQAVVRPARMSDIDALLRLEATAFEHDRISRRQFHHLLTKAHAACLVAEVSGRAVGYALLLFRRGTSLARLYSVATDGTLRRQGVGRSLLAAAEDAAVAHEAWFLRLEVRPDNLAAIRLYLQAGYRRIGTYLDYYEDHSAALRFEKRLPASTVADCRVPYYAQTTEFTCGPAALMMAMASFDAGFPLGQRSELELWREATTIFMTSGAGGCDPFGLALAAHRRGFGTEIFVSQDDPMFLDGVRSGRKRDIMRLVQEVYREQAAEAGIPVHREPLTGAQVRAYAARRSVCLTLVSHYRMHRQKAPHWLVVHGIDDRFVYVHDPWIDEEDMDTLAAKANLPIPIAEFERMSRYGRTRVKAAVVVSDRPTP